MLCGGEGGILNNVDFHVPYHGRLLTDNMRVIVDEGLIERVNGVLFAWVQL